MARLSSFVGALQVFEIEDAVDPASADVIGGGLFAAVYGGNAFGICGCGAGIGVLVLKLGSSSSFAVGLL